ncbi:MAG: peptide chain release factor N(5)-glutamine methyltransferase [Bacteroidales bacterium]|nr:peptide chain release factor N(5)-glutamine methyltransferase [Bacteroidales bacterium]
MLLKDFVTEGTRALESLYPTEEARSIILMLCERLAGTKSYTHVVEPGYELSPEVSESVQAALLRLQAGEPIQYVLGVAEFCGHEFVVGPDVLIPRPETEQLAMEAAELARRGSPARVLDLCTGSGCIAWTVALASPEAEVIGVDISDGALQVASSQPLPASPVFLKADVLEVDQPFEHGQFDLILSNPPYIKDCEKTLMRTNVLDFEPATALFVPDVDPLVFYRAIALWSLKYMLPSGVGLTEINETLGPETAQIFMDAGFGNVEVVKDIFGKDRFVRYSH